MPLKPKAVDTLILLIENRDRVVSKREIMDRLWPDSFVEEGNLTQNIYVLRKTLGRDQEGQDYIETLPRRGYRFIGNVVEQSNTERDAVEDAMTATEQPSEHPRRRLKVLPLTVFGVVLAAVLVVAYLLLYPTARPSIRSVAVLPFKTLAPDTSGRVYRSRHR